MKGVDEAINNKKDLMKVNEQIRADNVMLIDEKSENKGIVPLSAALSMAKEKGLDLVAINTDSVPIICKIMDYSRYRFEKEKKKKKSMKSKRTGQMKEIRMGPLIGQHDIDTKNRHIAEFLKEGYKVKVTVIFRGRQMAHIDIGKNVLLAVIEQFKGIAICEQAPILEGNRMAVLLRANK